MSGEIKSFQYKTNEDNIKRLKFLALEHGVNARDILDIALDIFETIMITDSEIITNNDFKSIIEKRLGQI